MILNRAHHRAAEMKLCTKLVQWLTLAGLFFAVWISLVFEVLPVQLSHATYRVVLVLPLYLLVCFGSYSLATIGYRLTTFNDCVGASEELMAEVQQARDDLTKKGLKF